MTWDEVALSYGTDKASSYHGYMDAYERWMAARADSVLNALEIGVLHGWSLSLWADVFPNARVTGVDVDTPTRFVDHDRISVEIADATDPDAMRAVLELGPFDFVVDDGSHHIDDVAASFRLLRPFLSPSAVYVVEDTRIGPPHPSGDPAPLGDVLTMFAADEEWSRLEVVRSNQRWGEYHWQALVLVQMDKR